MFILIFSTTLSETFLILRRIQRHITVNVHRYSCRVSIFLSDFSETWIFSTVFRKILQCQISPKSVQWRQSWPVRTDMKLIVTFRNSANAPKISFRLYTETTGCHVQRRQAGWCWNEKMAALYCENYTQFINKMGGKHRTLFWPWISLYCYCHQCRQR